MFRLWLWWGYYRYNRQAYPTQSYSWAIVVAWRASRAAIKENRHG